MDSFPGGSHAELPQPPEVIEAQVAPEQNPRSGRRNALIAAAGFASYILLQILAVRLRLSNPLAYYGVAILALLIALGYTVSLARALRSVAAQAAAVVVSAAITLPFVLLPFLHISTPQQLAAARRIYTVYVLVFRAAPGLRGLLLITLATCVGVIVSRLVREIKLLLPVGVVLALVDLYVVFGGGMVTQANSGKSPMAQAAMNTLTVGLMPRMPANVPAPPPLAVGFADFLFIALFFACFARFRVPARRTFVLLCGILCLYLMAVIVGHLDLPALVPIAVVVIGSNLSAFRFSREETVAMVYAGLIVAGILAAMVFASHR